MPAANTQYATLTASVVTTLNTIQSANGLTVTNRDGAAEVFFTVDGTVPTVGGAGTYMIPAAAGASIRVIAPTTYGATVVQLISSGAPKIEIDPTSLTMTPGTVAGGGTSVATPGVFRLEDGASTNLATVAQFHNADNQVLPGTSYGLNTGGVAQLLNAAGGIDRQRETALDGIPAAGVATGTQQLAVPFSTTVAGNIAVGANVVVTPASMTNIQAGSTLQIANSNGTNLENVFVSAVTGTTFTAGFTQTKTGPGITVKGFIYNQARDASIGDNVPGTGLSPSATFLWNVTNSKFELDRSAAGEMDGATGNGTAVAAEYEWNGGGPITNTGAISGLGFDRARSLQAKFLGSSTLNGAVVAGGTSLTFTAVPGLEAGQQIVLDRLGANPEGAYVSTTYVPGALTVPLQSAMAFAHASGATVEWDEFGVLGPQLNGFTGAGIGIEETALFDPVTKQFFLERASTQDAMPPQNIVAESGAVWNGTSFDRMRAAYADALPTTGIEAANDMLWNGASYDRARSVQGLATTAAIGRESAHPGLPVFTSLNAATATANGAALDCVVAHQTVTMQLNLTSSVAPTTISTQLQGSLDNVNWFNIGAANTTTATGTYVVSSTGIPARYYRAATTITGGTAVSMTALLAVAA